MQLIKPKVHKFENVVAIILPEYRVAAVEKLIDRYSSKNWRVQDRIYLIPISDAQIKNQGHVAAVVRKQCRSFGMLNSPRNIRYLVFNELEYRPHTQIDWVSSADFISSVTYKLLADDLLEMRLREWGLHWRQAAAAELRKWQYDEIDEIQIQAWLDQFNLVSGGSCRWVGEQLLRNFKIWSADEIAVALSRAHEDPSQQTSATVIRYENGKSADAISIILRKKLQNLIAGSEIDEYCLKLEASEKSEFDIYEDGLFTGIEISDFYSSLLGIEGYKKCPPLSDPSRLHRTRTRIRFAVGTDIGLNKLKSRIEKLGISVQIILGNEIKVLTRDGNESLQAGTLYTFDAEDKEVLSDSVRDIVPQAFIDESWGERKQQAIDFCRDLGFALWKSVLVKQRKTWTDKRISDCALGAGNIALPFSFSHSVPKSTLPVFWCHGVVKGSRGKKFDWQPLFPSAHAV